MTIFAGTIFDKHEELARTMFENAGFSLDDSSQRMSVHMPYDFVASKEKRQYFVEVKTSLSLNYRNIAGILSWMQKLSLVAEKANAIPVLFCFALMSASERDNLKKQCKNLIVFDLANILYYLKETELYNEVVSSLSFNVI